MVLFSFRFLLTAMRVEGKQISGPPSLQLPPPPVSKAVRNNVQVRPVSSLRSPLRASLHDICAAFVWIRGWKRLCVYTTERAIRSGKKLCSTYAWPVDGCLPCVCSALWFPLVSSSLPGKTVEERQSSQVQYVLSSWKWGNHFKKRPGLRLHDNQSPNVVRFLSFAGKRCCINSSSVEKCPDMRSTPDAVITSTPN